MVRQDKHMPVSLAWNLSITQNLAATSESQRCVQRLDVQGEVEQISLMKPKAEDKNDTGLLEYLEDIIGTDKYIPCIEEESKK
jgi:chromosome segregation ATPase